MHRFVNTPTRFLGILVLGMMMMLAQAPANAQSLNDLRASGAIGEAFDGFARARDPGVSGKVDAVNAQRRAIYQERAAAQGVSPGQVGRVYAQQIFSQAPPGTWFLGESGNWTRK